MSEQKSPSECFETMKEKIEAVPEHAHVRMTIPYEDAMKEAQRVTLLVGKYRDRLAESDISPELLDEIGMRSGAFAHCVTLLETHAEINESHNAQFALQRREGYTLRRKILADYDYIFRADTEVKQVLGNIREGRGDLDMIKDLLSLHKMSVDFGKRLEEAHFNFGDSQRAYELYNELLNLSALRDIDPEKMSEVKRLHIKSWTLLWQALEEIYAAGRYVFYEQPEIEELFYMDYWQKISAKQNRTTQDSVEPVVETVTEVAGEESVTV